ncbi:MAG: hypothetical protein LBH98_07865 [Chitinispirillales bacterium]|nr:hypothetical protein [Chitinispirillales bacterium]
MITEIVYREEEYETREYPNVEYSPEFISRTVKGIVSFLASNGHPFVKISPKITEKNDSITVDLFIDKGTFVKTSDVKFIINGKLKYYLAEKPIENILKSYYDYYDFEKVKNILQSKKYINSVSIFFPEINDSSIEIPIKIEPVNSVFFDGGLGFATYPKNTVTGNASLGIVNVFGAGEIVNFSYFAEELFYKLNGDFEIPYILRTSVGALFSAEIEVSDSLYGSVSLSAGTQFFGEKFSMKIMMNYSELTIGDTLSRYTGINFLIDNGAKKFTRSNFAAQTEFSAKSGVISDKKNWMPKGEISAQFAIHIPVGNSRLAFLTKPSVGMIAFETPQNLHRTQIFRIGGAKSVRGYQESIFPCLSFGILGNDFRYYISESGAVYLLFDYGAAMDKEYDFFGISQIFGYGAGITIPVGKLSFSLEWARHYKEFSSLGRIHFRIGNY